MANDFMEELRREGVVAPWPDSVAIPRRGDGRDVAYLATKPVSIGGPNGTRQLRPGDVLSAEEARWSGSGLRAMVLRNELIEVPADTGVVGVARALLERVARLEDLVVALSLSDTELLQLARERGLLKGIE